MQPAQTLKALNQEVDRLVDRTPESRDRCVDFLRAFSIVVVILWHWTFSITHRDNGGLVMPNPIDVIPLGWLATWLLQVMPVFFFVGGFANLAGWQAVRRDGGGWRDFYARRAWRLLAPVAVFLGVWTLVEIVTRFLVADYRPVWEYGLINFIPLWFIAAYVWVVALVPVTARLHASGCELTIVLLGAAIVLTDLARFQFGVDGAGLVNTALVWVFVHQLGYFYRDGTLIRWPVRRRASLAVAALTGLVVLTSLDVYPRSMVAVEGADLSHMYPTTAGVAVLALFQVGVVMLLRPYLGSMLQRRALWKSVVAVNAVILTLFLWHMTALLLAIFTYERFGGTLGDAPTAVWWAQRPLWIALPAAFLAVLVGVFSRIETVRPSR